MAEVVEREGISAVWLVPFIALIFGGWLLYKSISERGIFITVQFENANGIVVGKTEVKYKGLTVGVVKDIDVSADLQSVIVDIEMIAASDEGLTDETLFWYVTADVSFQGVKGLDTLLSGSYISIKPDIDGTGESQREFIALDEAPELDMSTPGLHLTLTSDRLGSISKDSPVSFKQINVGYVSGHSYDEASDLVLIHIYIEPEHAHLVKTNTRFWNASGVHISGSLSTGIQVNTESLASLVSGGVAFDNLPFEAEQKLAKNGEKYTLFNDYLDAQMGHDVRLTLGWNSHIDIGAPVVYQGLTVGRVKAFDKIDPASRKIIASVKMNPRVEPYLTSESQFFVAAPSIDLGGVTNLNQVLTGAHIGFRPSGEGERQDEFMVFGAKPAYKYTEPGLHLVLKADHVESLNVGSGIYFEQQQVGTVQALENLGPNQFLVHIFIKPEYQSYVSKDSQFWNASGMRITGNLQGFEVQTQSIQSILKGGIGFDSGINSVSEQPNNGELFTLKRNKDIAKERTAFTLSASAVRDVNIGMRIMYKGEKVGSVHSMARNQEQVLIHVGLQPEFEFLLREGSQFWLVKADVSLSGISDTDALLGGTYFNVNLGDGEPLNHFQALLAPPKKPVSSEGLQVTLVSESGNVADPGGPVSYRGVVVGQVDNISLNQADDNVLIHLTIEEQYRHLINGFTRFYSASGVTITGNLNKVVVKTESMDAIVTGGISFYNGKEAEGKSEHRQANEGDLFTLYDNIAIAKAAGLPITLHFNELDGLQTGQSIKYKGQVIGIVERLTFDHSEYGVKVVAFLNDAGKKFAVNGTKFWLVKPKLGLVGSQNLDALVERYIAALPSDIANAEVVTTFNAEDIPPAVTSLPYGLNLKLNTSRLGSVRVGDPVLYRQVNVGEVIGVDLASTADTVNIYINIANKYAKLVTTDSEFWNTSGVHIEAGLFSGVTIDSESLETIMSGGISFATPSFEGTQSSVSNGHEFILQQDVQSQWHDWQPKISLTQ